MERHTEIEYVLRPALFWDSTQHKVVIPLWCFWITNQSFFKGQDVQEEHVMMADSLEILMSVRGTDCYRAYMMVADFQGRHSLVYIFKEKL
jgi:hypothetical protein